MEKMCLARFRVIGERIPNLKGDMIGVEDARGRRVPKPVGFGVGSIPNEDTRKRALIHFGQRQRVKCEGTAADLL